MAKPKRGQMMQVMFLMVDKTDFATIESGVAAASVTGRFFGVAHGGSAATTSGAISKAVSLIRSGLFRATIKSTENDYDFLTLKFTNSSCADRFLQFEMDTYTDSDIVSRLSDIGSDLRSYLAVMSGVQSDVYSLLSDLQSDFQSRVPKAVATNSQVSDLHSDLKSYLVVMSGVDSNAYSMLSDFYSDFQSRVPKAVATNSQLSDLQSDLRSYLVVMSGVQSDVYSLLSDLTSDFQSRVPKRVATDSQLSDVQSDLRSQIGGIAVTVTASDMSDIASRVWAEKYTAASNVKASTFGSALRLNMSRISDAQSYLVVLSGVQSDLYSLLSDLQSDFQSRVPKRVATDSQLSDVLSDLRSQIGGITATVSASDMSDIASRVWTEKYTAASNVKPSTFGSALRLNMSRISDAQSYLIAMSGVQSDLYSLLSDLQSDFQSRVPKAVATNSQVSDLSSDLRSLLVGLSSLDSDIYSQLSDFRSNIGARIPAALVGGRIDATVGALNNNVSAAVNLEKSASVIIRGAVDASPAPTTTAFGDTTNLTATANDFYKGRIIIFTSGTLAKQATDITAYTGATKVVTYTALTAAPTAADTYVIV